jgi:hypothetical protein
VQGVRTIEIGYTSEVGDPVGFLADPWWPTGNT